MIKFFTGMGHLCTNPLNNICLKSPCFESCQCPSLLSLQPYKESSLADTDGIVAVGHEGVGEQLLTHPVDLIQGATTIQILMQIFKAANYDNKYTSVVDPSGARSAPDGCILGVGIDIQL